MAKSSIALILWSSAIVVSNSLVERHHGWREPDDLVIHVMGLLSGLVAIYLLVTSRLKGALPNHRFWGLCAFLLALLVVGVSLFSTPVRIGVSLTAFIVAVIEMRRSEPEKRGAGPA